MTTEKQIRLKVAAVHVQHNVWQKPFPAVRTLRNLPDAEAPSSRIAREWGMRTRRTAHRLLTGRFGS